VTSIVDAHQPLIAKLAERFLSEMHLSVGALPEIERRAVVIGALATAVNNAIADARRRDPRFGELVEATFARNINLAVAGAFDQAAE